MKTLSCILVACLLLGMYAASFGQVLSVPDGIPSDSHPASGLSLLQQENKIDTSQSEKATYPYRARGGSGGIQPPSTNGRGIMVAGELWDSFLPMNKGPYFGEASHNYTTTLVRIGNFDRQWTTPTHLWPGGINFGNYWSKGIEMAEWNPSPDFNPASIGGKANPLYRASSGPNYCLAAYGNPGWSVPLTVPGQGDPTRDYAVETRFVDSSRHHAMYEAAWPTNLGVDVKMKVHQWTLNWNNFNDFIIMEFTLTNTGEKDINMDGVAESDTNTIHALTLVMHGEFMCSYELSRAGTRLTNRFGAQRAIGYVGDNDVAGQPVDMMVAFPGESTNGAQDMGLNNYPQRWYTDVWSGWAWLGAKTSLDADKTTMFGTHPIGTGAQRGWYTTGGQGKGLPVTDGGTATPDHKGFHTASMGVWYKDGGKSRDANKLDLSPDPNYFASGTAGNPETFVPKATPDRPRGDRKLLSFESMGAFEANPYDPGWGTGFSAATNFDGDGFSAIGPFHLDVGESVTITLVEVGGYRLQGVANAVQAARWAHNLRANDYAAFDAALAYPGIPDVLIEKTLSGSVKIRWDNAAEKTGAGSKGDNLAGYKIYRAESGKPFDFLATGMRGLDNYWQNVIPGATPTQLLKPVNPSFAAQNLVAGKVGLPEGWGPYELIAIVPKSQLGQYLDFSRPGYNYLWLDSAATAGYNYWYYVAAYTAEPLLVDLGPSYAGTNPRTTSTLETSNLNRNGASGLWMGTYPFADLSPLFPTTREGQKQIGSCVNLIRPLAYDTLSLGTVVLGSSRNVAIRVRNSADDDTMHIHGVSNNPAFILPAPTLSVPPRDSTIVNIQFTPWRLGLDTASSVFTIDGSHRSYDLFLAGRATSGTRAPNLAWEWVDPQPTTNPSSQLAAIDNSGTVYSAAVKSFRLWEIRKHDATGGIEWSLADSIYAPIAVLTGLVLDGSGNAYVGLNGVASGPPFNGAICVAKVTPGGQMEWKKAFTLPYDRAIYMCGLTIDGLGNIYSTGQSYSRSTGNNTCATTVKFSPDGNLSWVAFHEGQPVGTDSNDIGRAVAVDSLGNVYITGQSGANSRGDIMTVKYNSQGEFQWASYYAGPSTESENGMAIAVSSSGELYVAGQISDWYGGVDIVLLKYSSSDGSLLWADRYDGAAHLDDKVSSLLVAPDGAVFVCGTTTIAGGTSDGILLKYKQGLRQLLLQYDGPLPSNDTFSVLNLDQSGNVYAGGSCTGSLGLSEAALFKFAPNGALAWESHYQPTPTGNASLHNLAVGKTGVLAITGSARSSSYNVYVAAFGELTLSVSPVEIQVPTTCALLQNYPNPFNPTTTIKFNVAGVGGQGSGSSNVELVVYDLLGRRVAVLVDEKKQPGSYETQFDASRLASGVYIYRLKAGSFVQSRKMMLIK